MSFNITRLTWIEFIISTALLIAPNFVSEQVQIRIETFDVVNLSSSDTTAYFAISDNTPPTIAISTPTSGSSIAEYEDLTVTWSASDNIEMDSVRIHYSNDGGNWKKSNTELKNSTLNIIFEEPFMPRRGRVNCSLNDNGKWRWFGTQFTIKKN